MPEIVALSGATIIDQVDIRSPDVTGVMVSRNAATVHGVVVQRGKGMQFVMDVTAARNFALKILDLLDQAEAEAEAAGDSALAELATIVNTAGNA